MTRRFGSAMTANDDSMSDIYVYRNMPVKSHMQGRDQASGGDPRAVGASGPVRYRFSGGRTRRRRAMIPAMRRSLLLVFLCCASTAFAAAASPAAADPAGPARRPSCRPAPCAARRCLRAAPSSAADLAQPPIGRCAGASPPVRRGRRPRRARMATALRAELGRLDARRPASREDCLYLDVWTPEWPARAKRPVMVWLHGGGNSGGAGGSDPLYDGTRLVARGVVLVIVDYRLGVFGFFAHPELTRESAHHASGNYGLLDQLAACAGCRTASRRSAAIPLR